MRTNVKIGPNEQYLLDLSRRILDAYGMKDTPIVFRNRGKSTGWDKEIVYGTGCINACKTGWTTGYTTVAKALGIPQNAKNVNLALHLHALHECAHAVQFKRGQYVPGDAHGSVFIRTLRELAEKYPHPDMPKLNKVEFTPRSREWCMERYSVGEAVIFNGDVGEEVHGVIQSFNGSSMTIEGMDECGNWLFHYHVHDKFHFRKACTIDFSNLFD